MPLRFQQPVASTPALPLGWKYPVDDEESSVGPSSDSLGPKSPYVFGKRDEIKDLDMEDGSPGVVDPPLVVDGHQIVSVRPISGGYRRQCVTHDKHFPARRIFVEGRRVQGRGPGPWRRTLWKRSPPAIRS